MIAFVSDIHGNYPALEAVLKDIDHKGCDTVISLGDLVGYYCMFNECIDILRERGIVSLLGNHDYYLISGTSCPRSNSVNEIILQHREDITPSNRSWLTNTALGYDTVKFSARHGGWDNPLDEYISHFTIPKQHYPDVKFFISGHTHIQTIQNLGDIVYCNPGSVGQPRDGIPSAAYATFNDESFNLHRVEYDIDGICHAMSKNGYSDYYYKNLYVGKKIGD